MNVFWDVVGTLMVGFVILLMAFLPEIWGALQPCATRSNARIAECHTEGQRQSSATFANGRSNETPNKTNATIS